MSKILRSAFALAALVVAAWFGLGWVQARDTGRAQAIVTSSRLSPEQARQAASLLDSAGPLNPDRTVDMVRANLATDQHRNRRAIAILRSVTHAEPFNFLAWKQLVDAYGAAHRIHLATVAFLHLESLLAKPK